MFNKIRLGISYLWGVVRWATTPETLSYIASGIRVSEKLFGNDSNKKIFQKARRVQGWLDDLASVSRNTLVMALAEKVNNSDDPDFKDYDAKVELDKFGKGNDGITISLKDGKLSGGVELGIFKVGIDSEGKTSAGLKLSF